MSPSRPGFVQANTNGRLHDAAEPSLSPLNRGFLYGDAIYEVWRSYDRVVFAWAEHWARLQSSAAALDLILPWSAAELWGEITTTVRAFGAETGFAGDVYIRLQIFRGEGAIGLDPRLAPAPGFIVLVQPVPRMSAQHWETGLSLRMARSLRRNAIDTLNPAWKTGNYLNNLLCLHEAKSLGADDVVILNAAGQLTEASTSNIAFIRGREFVTPPSAAGILVGITRGQILAGVAVRAGLVPVERAIDPAELGGFAEAMLLSTTKDVQPVGRIDDVCFAVGPGTVTRNLKAAFAEHVGEYCAGHPEQTLD